MLSGPLYKMSTQLAEPVQYELLVGEQGLCLNDVLGKRLSLRYDGKISCIQCGRPTNKSFHQGHCYPCFRRLAECNFCTIHPEQCKIEHEPCPEGDWAHSICNASHVVYLANTSGLKVGITRVDQIPTRWIDQGATQALPIMQVANRYQSGIIEDRLKSYLHDKTNWRRMLQGPSEELDLPALRDELIEKTDSQLRQMRQTFVTDETEYLQTGPYAIDYPVEVYCNKVSSFNLDKQTLVTGKLQGIKGQYLIFDTGVINIRKFGGYHVTVEC